MKIVNKAIRSVAVVGVTLLFLFGTGLAYAQSMPQFKTVIVNGGVTGRCSVRVEYQYITNDSDNAAFRKINRANRIEVINQRAATTTDDVAVQDITAEMLDYYYDGMFALPYYSASQSARTVRGGRYVVFSTQVEMFMGGAHGFNTDDRSIYNLSTGNSVELSYLLTSGWGSAVKRYIYNRCSQQLGEWFEISSPFDMPEPSAYELTDYGVAFIFFPYEIAPYAVGNVRIELTDQEIRNLGAPIRW